MLPAAGSVVSGWAWPPGSACPVMSKAPVVAGLLGQLLGRPIRRELGQHLTGGHGLRCPPGGSSPQANFHVEWFQLGSPTLTTGAGRPLRPRMGGGQCGDTGGRLTLDFCNLFQSAVGHEYQSKLSKHCSQVDSVRGFGGKFGVQVDRVDQVSEASWAAGARGGQGNQSS